MNENNPWILKSFKLETIFFVLPPFLYVLMYELRNVYNKDMSIYIYGVLPLLLNYGHVFGSMWRTVLRKPVYEKQKRHFHIVWLSVLFISLLELLIFKEYIAFIAMALFIPHGFRQEMGLLRWRSKLRGYKTFFYERYLMFSVPVVIINLVFFVDQIAMKIYWFIFIFLYIFFFIDSFIKKRKINLKVHYLEIMYIFTGTLPLWMDIPPADFFFLIIFYHAISSFAIFGLAESILEENSPTITKKSFFKIFYWCILIGLVVTIVFGNINFKLGYLENWFAFACFVILNTGNLFHYYIESELWRGDNKDFQTIMRSYEKDQ